MKPTSAELINVGLTEVGQFYFVSSHGKVLQSHSNGEMHASQRVAEIGEEERWHVYVWSDGFISLMNYKTNNWLCCDNGIAICDRAQPAEWERWKLHGINTKVAFLSHMNTWLCAQAPDDDSDGGGEVIANRSTCGEWERFTMIPCEGIPIRNNTWWNSVKSVFNTANDLAPIIIAVLAA